MVEQIDLGEPHNCLAFLKQKPVLHSAEHGYSSHNRREERDQLGRDEVRAMALRELADAVQQLSMKLLDV